MRERYSERFFQPIQCLQERQGNEQGFGFAIMALCALLIETIECYRQGLPSSDQKDLSDLRNDLKVKCAEPAIKPPGSGSVFRDFFNNAETKEFLPGVNGDEFYKKIRCGLLHQAQTKGGWCIVRSGSFWNPDEFTINRDEFAYRLRDLFESFLAKLHSQPRDEQLWNKVKLKLCWLVASS